MGHRSPPAVEKETSAVWAGVLDVTSCEQCDAAVAGAVRRWGRLDVLVNNAGVTEDGLLAGMRDEAWDRVLDVHLKGAFLCCRAAMPVMLKQGEGHILNIGSYSGRVGGRGQANYAAAKAGLIGLSLSLAREVATAGVRVNAVLPGVLPTRMTESLSAEARDALVAQNLLRRMNNLEEVSGWIVELAGTRDVSGQVVQWDSRPVRWC